MDTPILVPDPSPFNVFKEKHLPSFNLISRLHDIWGIDVIRVKRVDDLYKAFTGAPSISANQLIDLYGIKYIVSVTPLEGDPRFELIYARLEGLQGRKEDLLKGNTIKLYKNRNPSPRAWLVKDFKVLDSKTILSTMAKKEFKPDREVLLEEEPKWVNPPSPPFTKGGLEGLKEPLSGTQNKGGQHLPAGRQGGPPEHRKNDIGEPLSACLPDRQGLPQKVEIISESNNRLDLQVKAAENLLLVLSDTYYPGWKAFVDGKRTKIYRADYTFRAIPLNAGTHQVEFVYDPMSFKLGAGVTFLGILGCLLIGWAVRRKGSTKNGTS